MTNNQVRIVFLKRIDRYLLSRFIPPLVLTFFIAQFVLVVQFFWKYIDDMVGKGLDTSIIVQLIFYASATIVPLALPLAILLSSIMTFGNLSEDHELTAIQSSGISILRVFKPFIFFVSILCLFTFYFSNNILPKANLKFKNLLYDIRNQKPTLNIKEGIFNTDFDNISLRAESKSPQNDALYGVIIYDHTQHKGNDNVLVAKKAKMYQANQGKVLVFELYDGYMFRQAGQYISPNTSWQIQRTYFKRYKKIFDLTQFDMDNTNKDFFSDLDEIKKISELNIHIDKTKKEKGIKIAELDEHVRNYVAFGDTIKPYVHTDTLGYIKFNVNKDADIEQKIILKMTNLKNYTQYICNELKYRNHKLVRLHIEWHRKFTLAISCIVLFLVGGALGAVTKKGGIGWPLLFAVLLFLVFHVSGMIGEKMAEKKVISPFMGMWLSTIILFPTGILLTLKASNYIRFFSKKYWINQFNKWVSIFKNKFDRNRMKDIS